MEKKQAMPSKKHILPLRTIVVGRQSLVRLDLPNDSCNISERKVGIPNKKLYLVSQNNRMVRNYKIKNHRDPL